MSTFDYSDNVWKVRALAQQIQKEKLEREQRAAKRKEQAVSNIKDAIKIRGDRRQIDYLSKLQEKGPNNIQKYESNVPDAPDFSLKNPLKSTVDRMGYEWDKFTMSADDMVKNTPEYDNYLDETWAERNPEIVEGNKRFLEETAKTKGTFDYTAENDPYYQYMEEELISQNVPTEAKFKENALPVGTKVDSTSSDIDWKGVDNKVESFVNDPEISSVANVGPTPDGIGAVGTPISYKTDPNSTLDIKISEDIPSLMDYYEQGLNQPLPTGELVTNMSDINTTAGIPEVASNYAEKAAKINPMEFTEGFKPSGNIAGTDIAKVAETAPMEELSRLQKFASSDAAKVGGKVLGAAGAAYNVYNMSQNWDDMSEVDKGLGATSATLGAAALVPTPFSPFLGLASLGFSLLDMVWD